MLQLDERFILFNSSDILCIVTGTRGQLYSSTEYRAYHTKSLSDMIY